MVDPTAEDIVKRVDELTAGEGADVGFDAAGVQGAVDTALKAIKARGTLVNIAVWEKRATLNMNDVVFRERGYMGGMSACDSLCESQYANELLVATYALGDFEAVLDAISSGRMDPKGMITKTIKMDEIVEEGFKTLIEDKDNHVKILVDVSQKV